MTRLLTDFQGFWRENSEIWQEGFEYKEASPHLILQAFLQRVINPSTGSGRFGDGRILREMAGGRKRLDLCVEYQDQRYPVELKIRYDGSTEAEGIEQLAGYMDILGCTEGWLLPGRTKSSSEPPDRTISAFMCWDVDRWEGEKSVSHPFLLTRGAAIRIFLMKHVGSKN